MSAMPPIGARLRVTGRLDPATGLRRRGRGKPAEYEIRESSPNHLRLWCDGCWPEDGFRVSAEHWRALWLPQGE